MNSERVALIPAAANGSPGLAVDDSLQGSCIFYCINATGAFRVRADKRDALTGSSGKGFGNPKASTFKRLTFYNDSNVSVTVTYWVGDEEYKDQSVPSPSIAVPVRDQTSYSLGSGTQVMAGNTSLEFLGYDNAARRRKQIVVTNLDAANVLKIFDGQGVVMMTVFPLSSITLFTDAHLFVRNPNVGNISVEVGEIFYA